MCSTAKAGDRAHRLHRTCQVARILPYSTHATPMKTCMSVLQVGASGARLLNVARQRQPQLPRR